MRVGEVAGRGELLAGGELLADSRPPLQLRATRKVRRQMMRDMRVPGDTGFIDAWSWTKNLCRLGVAHVMVK